MLDAILIIYFIIVAFKVIRGVLNESLILEEFKQSKILVLFILLLPAGPLLLLVLPHRTGWLPAVIIVSLCYVPTFLISRKQYKVLECSGTDRTRKLINIVNMAFLASCVGLIYVFLVLVFGLAASKMSFG